MLETIIVAVISLVGTCLGAFSGMRLVSYRVEQLEKKVDKHNSVIERTCKLENAMEVVVEDIRELKQRAS